MKAKNRKEIPNSVLTRLWARSAGRCAYTGCNEVLWEDILTRRNYNQAYIAHIIAAEPDGPRGDDILSPKLCQDYENLMLLCDRHHRLIDRVDVAGHPPNRLYEMKLAHEDRMDRLTGIQENKKSQIILYLANVGPQTPALSNDIACETITPAYYPASSRAIDLAYRNSVNRDHDPAYWQIEEHNLINQYKEKVAPLCSDGSTAHFSIFAFAPQPLLIKLGALLGDAHAMDIYQRHRQPPSWKWQLPTETVIYRVIPPAEDLPTVALNISLSARINNDRIYKTLGANCSIWTITIDSPNLHFVRSPTQLAAFRQIARSVYDEVNFKYGQPTPLHVFPAMPNSLAIEFGRSRLPKVDVPLVVYDNNKETDGFSKALTIN
ncbi:SAVED domain-containing protein [Fibrisoma limi]|nr:SAVED domain-containing protein [Fibrisoma limi]